jgi:CheY-like chemotaxis protein
MTSHIFVVDDDPSIVRLARTILNVEGLEIEAFTSPTEALSRIQDDSVPNPVAIVLDLNMAPTRRLGVLSSRTRCGLHESSADSVRL